MKIKGMIFDLDGVILDSMEVWRGIVPYLSGKLGVEIGDDEFSKLQTMSVELSAKYILERYDVGITAEELMRMVTEHIDLYYRSHVGLKEGVADALAIFRMNGKKMCLASATPRPMVKAALYRTGVYDYLRKIVTVQEVGIGKQSPEIFEAARKLIGTDPAETIVVEDSHLAIRTAKNAGFLTAAVEDDINGGDLDTVSDLTDVRVRGIGELYDHMDR